MQSIDFLLSSNKYLITGVYYAFGVEEEELEEGYWDSNKEWHLGKFYPYRW